MNMDNQLFAAAMAAAMAAMNPTQRRQRAMTVSTQATPFGCCNFFDGCGDGDIMSAHFSAQLPLLDWMGFNVTSVCQRSVEYISFVRPAYVDGNPTVGYLADPCEDPKGVEWGSCKLTTEDFGRIGRIGPTRDVMKPKKYCETDPIWRLDGAKVTDEREWDMKFVMDQVIADVSKLLVTGNAATPGQFNGLEQWVKTGYECSILNSIVVDWNGNPMSGGAGITWNGTAVASTFDLVDVLLAAFRRIKQRISWSPRLKTQKIGAGDMILVLPTDLIQCLLDFYTCWSVCAGSEYNEVSLQSYEARNFRNGLLGGTFGMGEITLDGQKIPLLGYDWDLIKGPSTGDIYFLTGSVGNFRIWEGEHLSADVTVAENPEAGYFASDNGRVIWKIDTENLCRTMKGWMMPRLFNKAPWSQVRIMNVQCQTPGGFLSPDPTETSFYPLTSFSQAECP